MGHSTATADRVRFIAADKAVRQQQPPPTRGEGTLRRAPCSIPWVGFFIAALLALFGVGDAVAAEPSGVGDPNADWPCIQHKVATLTAAQMWDGPPVDNLTAWQHNEAIGKLIPTLANRGVPLETATAALDAFAAAQPEDKRDEALKQLFAGLLSTVNDDRRAVMNGIERFQRRQRERAHAIEREAEAIRLLREKAPTDAKARADLAAAEDHYNWDARIFSDRQQSLPLACEIPVLIEQRLFDLAREIRSHMHD